MDVRRGLWMSVVLVLGGSAAAQEKTRRPGNPDDERARAVEAQFRKDPQLKDDAIVVEVNGKRVRLVGEVDGAGERQHAGEVVKQIDPTLIVENLLQPSADPAREPETKGRAERAVEAASNAAERVGDSVSDAWITSRVKAQIVADDAVDAGGIDVDTEKQVVTLRGRVRSETERRRVIDIARLTRGVLVIVDEMKTAGR